MSPRCTSKVRTAYPVVVMRMNCGWRERAPQTLCRLSPTRLLMTRWLFKSYLVLESWSPRPAKLRSGCAYARRKPVVQKRDIPRRKCNYCVHACVGCDCAQFWLLILLLRRRRIREARHTVANSGLRSLLQDSPCQRCTTPRGIMVLWWSRIPHGAIFCLGYLSGRPSRRYRCSGIFALRMVRSIRVVARMIVCRCR